MGFAAIESHGHPLPDFVKLELEGCDGWILGPHDSAAYPQAMQAFRNPSGELRHHFDLYANIRPAKTFPGIASTARDMDLVVVRENTEGFYPDRNMFQGHGEFMPTPEVAMTVGVFTRRALLRIAHAAFRVAMERRRHLTVVHKANVLPMTTGMLRSICREIAVEYPQVTLDDFHVDAMCAHLVRRPADFDVLVTENMFGDIVSDLTGELAGSLGLSASVNAGDERAMAQAVHGAAPDIRGEDLANPVAEILSAAMLARWLARRRGDDRLAAAGDRVESAVRGAIQAGIMTRDLGGSAGTRAMTDAVIERL